MKQKTKKKQRKNKEMYDFDSTNSSQKQKDWFLFCQKTIPSFLLRVCCYQNEPANPWLLYHTDTHNTHKKKIIASNKKKVNTDVIKSIH